MFYWQSQQIEVLWTAAYRNKVSVIKRVWTAAYCSCAISTCFGP